MSSDTTTAPNPPPAVTRRTGLQQRSVLLAVLAAAIVLDQASKWWAWRHTPAIINAGGDWLAGHTLSRWYAGPTTGALLDVLDVGLISFAAAILVRRRRPALVLASGAVMIGGWSSNLLDRLGMHYLTAPGSVRGAVDFIHIGHDYYNIADFAIIGATPLFLLAIGHLGRHATNGLPAIGPILAPRQRRRPARGLRWAAAGTVCLVVVVAVGATKYGGVTDAPIPAAASVFGTDD